MPPRGNSRGGTFHAYKIMIELKENETLEDLLIDGLKIIQSKDLYRFSSDAVMLSKFASFKKGDKVIDLCAGSGIVGLHFYALHRELASVKEVEIQPELASLCQRSVEYNGLQEVFAVENMPLQELPSDENGKYSLVLCNPPYKKAGSGETNPIKSVAIARHELTVTLHEVVTTAKRLLSHGGRFCICQRIERFTDVFAEMRNAGIEPYKLQFAVAAEGKEPYLFMVEGVKGVSRKFTVLSTILN